MAQAKLGALAMTALVLVYLVLVGERSIALIASGTLVGALIGYLMLALPLFAVWVIVMELRFGVQIEKLGKALEQRGSWPRFNFELRPSGRPTRDSAEKVFEEFRSRALADEANWESWFALGLAYDACGDRRRARKAMRTAIRLANNPKSL